MTRGRPPTFFRPGWEWIDPLREAQDVQFRIAGMSAGLLAQGQPVYLGDDGAVRFDRLGTFLGVVIQASPDANGTVTIRMGRQEARVDLAQERQRRHPTRGRPALHGAMDDLRAIEDRLAAQIGVPAELLRDDWRAR